MCTVSAPTNTFSFKHLFGLTAKSLSYQFVCKVHINSMKCQPFKFVPLTFGGGEVDATCYDWLLALNSFSNLVDSLTVSVYSHTSQRHTHREREREVER